VFLIISPQITVFFILIDKSIGLIVNIIGIVNAIIKTDIIAWVLMGEA
jgi:hypothetical protein